MSTANISQDIRGNFPLHSAVWENDYRKLEEEIGAPQVGKTPTTALHKFRVPPSPPKNNVHLLGEVRKETLNLFSHRVEVGQSC